MNNIFCFFSNRYKHMKTKNLTKTMRINNVKAYNKLQKMNLIAQGIRNAHNTHNFFYGNQILNISG